MTPTDLYYMEQARLKRARKLAQWLIRFPAHTRDEKTKGILERFERAAGVPLAFPLPWNPEENEKNA